VPHRDDATPRDPQQIAGLTIVIPPGVAHWFSAVESDMAGAITNTVASMARSVDPFIFDFTSWWAIGYDALDVEHAQAIINDGR